MRVLLDTNVILDFFLARGDSTAPRRIFELVYQEEITAYTTASSITDIYYIVAKRLGDSAARSMLKSLFYLVEIIAVDGNDCFSALNLPISDYEDAVISICAAKDNLDFIITNDTEFIKTGSPSTSVISPANFVSMH